MELPNHYNADSVNSSERLARIVLSPRDIDPVTNYPKDTFIGLRQDELYHYLKYAKGVINGKKKHG